MLACGSANYSVVQPNADTRPLASSEIPPGSLLAEFEAIYRTDVGAIMAFFARRCSDPETVADLTSETFVEAAGSYESFDRRRGTPRAWLFGVARRVYARQSERWAREKNAASRLAGRRMLDADEFEELTARIDAEREARGLLERLDRWPAERTALELVDLTGLAPAEAARVLGISVPTLRVRLFRARHQLRTKGGSTA
jgi:RNA polymerase sigma factor (sigma-70 family)